MMAAILNSAIFDSAICTKINFTLAFSLQIDDGSHLEFCHLGFSHFCTHFTSLIHSDSTWWWQPSWILPSWIQPFCTKKTSLIHSDSTWWWQPSWSLPCWIQTLPSWIQTSCYLFSDSLKNTLTPFWLWLKLINLMMAAILNSAIFDSNFSLIQPYWTCHQTLPSWIQTSSLRFNQKYSPSTWLWLKLIQYDLKLIQVWFTWWWQPSWTLPSWIQPFCTK